MNRINRHQYKGIIQNLTPSIEDEILEIGFGNGFLINYLCSKSDAKLSGIDISNDMVNTVIKDNIQFIKSNQLVIKKGSVSNIPFEDKSFNKVYTVNTIYFWDNFKTDLKEISRVLKKDGLFYNVFYSKDWLDKISYTENFQKLTLSEIKALTMECGFEIIDTISLKSDSSYCLISRKVEN